MLIQSRFVDDIGDSDQSMKALQILVNDANETFGKIGLACKGWTFSHKIPPEDVREENNTVSIGGMRWHSEMELLEVPIPKLHFSKTVRGRLIVGAQLYEGTMLEDMDKFVPEKLTRRMIFSKKAKIFDLLGKLTPITAGFSLDVRQAVKQTNDWDDHVPPPLRMKWVKNFHFLEQLRGLKFARARMPEEAISTEMDLIIAGDTAKSYVKIVAVWGRFKLPNNRYSYQLIIGRSLLGDEDSSIPKEELESLAMCSNLGWIVRNMLEKWISSYIVISDSTIALSWVMSDKNRLSLFHRNRAVQVRRGTDLDKLYHVTTKENPCDIGTRPDLISIEDVGPESQWEKGIDWMNEDIKKAIDQGFLTPAKSLSVSKEEEDDFNKDFIFEKGHKILTRGHPALTSVAGPPTGEPAFPDKESEGTKTMPKTNEGPEFSSTVKKMAERVIFSKYPLVPNKYKFEKVVRIYCIVSWPEPAL